MPPRYLPRGNRRLTRERELPPVMHSHVQEGGEKPCYTMTGVDISTVGLPEGHFVALTLSRPDLNAGAILVADADEIESIIATLKNAVEDAALLDQGIPPKHAIGSPSRH